MSKELEKLYEQSLMKWGFDWLPTTPPDGYLNSFDEFKQKMESDNEFYNKVVKELIAKDGTNKVLFIQHTGKEKCSMVGDQIAKMAADNGWKGIVTNGYIRDAEVIKDIPIGVYAKNTYPKKTDKSIGVGEVGVALDFESMIVKKGTWIYVDTNGWVISEKELEI